MSEKISFPFGSKVLDKYNNGEEISDDETSILYWSLLINNYNEGKKCSLEERCTLFWSVLDYYNKGKVHPKKIRYMKLCRRIIREHHEKMQNDPERLTSDFLIKLTRCNCKRAK
jgi:hypothetical protein